MSNRPNFLLLTSDQQHWFTLGIENPEIRTPNLDRLARAGTRYSRAYTTNPTCTPARASLITGMHPSQHGAYSLGTKLPEDRTTVGEVLSEAGYRTALVGKAHFQPLLGTEEFPSMESYPLLRDLDFWRGFHGPFYGFDHVELARNHADECHVGQHYALWMEEQGLLDWRRHFRNRWNSFDFSEGELPTRGQQHSWSLPEKFHYNTWIAERSNALMEDFVQAGSPFLLWASFFDPHPPYLVPEPWASMYDPEALTLPGLAPGEHDRNPPHFSMTQEAAPDFSAYQESGGNETHGLHSHLHDEAEMRKDMAVYYGMISCMDASVGRILDKLDELGQTENTVVLFTSDHGHFFGHHGLTAKGPFLYEDLVRIPFIVSVPGQAQRGGVAEGFQSIADIAPTFLSLAGVKVPGSMTGIDQSAVWKGSSTQARSHVIVENRHQPTTVHQKSYIDARYKITVYYNHDYGELFDLERDPGETRNLWDDPDSAALKAELLLHYVHAELGKEPLPMPRVAGA